MQPKEEIALNDQIEEWKNVHSEVFIDMLNEWKEHEVIKKVENPAQDFKCNNCGECCKFSPDVYASDVSDWLEDERYDILCAIFPMVDENENITYGLPTKRMLFEKVQEIMEEKSLDNKIKNAYKRILNAIKQNNTDFDNYSDTCIYYNAKIEQHCLIHDIAPFSCQAYPYDNPIFTKTIIPEVLSKKYGKTEGSEELTEELPLCPAECFSKGDSSLHTDCSHDDLSAVLLDKINYLSSSVLENKLNIDISAIFAQLYSSKIKNTKKRLEKTNSSGNEKQSIGKKISKPKNGSESGKVVKMSFGPKKSKK